jgi:hypothetical protein
MTNIKGITLYYAPNNQEQLHGIMTIVGKNNDPPLSIEPYESEECNSDICGFPDYETMVKAFVNTKKRVNGGMFFKILLTNRCRFPNWSYWETNSVRIEHLVQRNCI